MDNFLDLFKHVSLFDMIYIIITILSLIKCYKKGFVLGNKIKVITYANSHFDADNKLKTNPFL